MILKIYIYNYAESYKYIWTIVVEKIKSQKEGKPLADTTFVAFKTFLVFILFMFREVIIYWVKKTCQSKKCKPKLLHESFHTWHLNSNF